MTMKLVMFDLDGTLLTSPYDISEENRQAFRQLYLKGYRLGVATGRRVNNIEFLLRDDIVYFDVLIGENGFQTRDLKLKEDTYTRLLTELEIKEIIDLFYDESKDVNFCHFTDEGTYVYGDSEFTRRQEGQEGRKLIYMNGKPFDHLPKICMPVGIDFADEFRERIEHMSQRSYHGVMTGKGFFEFMDVETSKWKALEKYMKKNHLQKEDVIAFGDSGNDMEILSNVGFAVAMRNADDKVKAICHDVTDKICFENGIADYIYRKLLSN